MSDLNRDASIDDISGIVELGPENAQFSRSGDFLSLRLDEATAAQLARIRTENAVPGSGDVCDPEQLREYARVSLRRAFPFDTPDSYISVFDGDGAEIGMIIELGELEPEQAELIRKELDAVYYMPQVRRIRGISNKRGFQLWQLDTDAGETEITVRNSGSSIIRESQDRLIILDQSGNRYEIPSVEALDSTSRKKLDLYL